MDTSRSSSQPAGHIAVEGHAGVLVARIDGGPLNTRARQNNRSTGEDPGPTLGKQPVMRFPCCLTWFLCLPVPRHSDFQAHF